MGVELRFDAKDTIETYTNKIETFEKDGRTIICTDIEFADIIDREGIEKKLSDSSSGVITTNEKYNDIVEEMLVDKRVKSSAVETIVVHV